MAKYVPGQILIPWLNPRLEVHLAASKGLGLYTRANIHEGEEVIRWGGTIFTRKEILNGKVNPETIAIIGHDLYLADPIGTLPMLDYPLNHSCDPNLWMKDEITLIARRQIEQDEELTADYTFWMYEQNWVLDNCQCGSPLCRKRITDQDWLLPELQIRYAGHFSPFINELISKN